MAMHSDTAELLELLISDNPNGRCHHGTQDLLSARGILQSFVRFAFSLAPCHLKPSHTRLSVSNVASLTDSSLNTSRVYCDENRFPAPMMTLLTNFASSSASPFVAASA